MAIKLYEDGTTKELVMDNGIEYRFPAFSEIQRQKYDESLILKTVSDILILEATLFSDLTDSGGTPYASYAALKTALDGYFDAAV